MSPAVTRAPGPSQRHLQGKHCLLRMGRVLTAFVQQCPAKTATVALHHGVDFAGEKWARGAMRGCSMCQSSTPRDALLTATCWLTR